MSIKRLRASKWVGVVVLGIGVVLAVVVFSRLRTIFFPPDLCADQPPPVEAGGGHWVSGAPIPTMRGETRVGEANDLVFLFGGMTTEWAATSVVERYDAPSNSWKATAPLPFETNHPGVATIGGKIYVAGGYDSPNFTFNVKAMWRYDPQADTWEYVTELPEVRAAHVMKAINDKLYLAGGDGPADVTSVWMYDPATNTWDTSLAHMSTERDHAAAAVVDNKLYVIGGRYRQRHGNLALNEVYDPATDTWTRLPDMPVARSGLTADAINGEIHVTGGEDIDNFCTYNEHDVYDPATNTWTRWPNLPKPRHGLTSAVVGDRWYVFGGAVSSGPYTKRTFTTEIDIFIPDEN